MLRVRKCFISVLALCAATVALAVPAQNANAAGPMTQVIVWGDSMSLAWGAYLEPLLGVPVIRNGVGSEDVQQTQVRFNQWFDNATPTERNTTGHLCWCGGVNANIYHQGTAKDLTSVVPVLQAMAQRVPAGLFEPMSLSNMPEAARGTPLYKQAIDDQNAATRNAANERMSDAFGTAYAETRVYMITQGLADAGITPTAADNTNISQDVVPQSLRRDPDDPHLNDAGKHLVATRLNTLLRADGWVAPETRRPTNTDAASSLNPAPAGTGIRVTATVTNTTGQGGIPTGTVQFVVDGRPLAAKATLNSQGIGISPLIRNLAVGNHTVSTNYSGSATFAGSTDSFVQVIGGS